MWTPAAAVYSRRVAADIHKACRAWCMVYHEGPARNTVPDGVEMQSFLGSKFRIHQASDAL